MTFREHLTLAKQKATAAFTSEAVDNRGQTNLVGLFIGLMIAGIVAIQVFIPVILDAVNNSNASGTTLTVLELLPLFAALLLLIALAAPLMRRI